MGVSKVECSGYDNLLDQIRTFSRPELRRTFVYFTGAKSPETGHSWCPDCVKAEPNVQKAFDKLEGLAENETAIIICNVEREYWKDKSNALRTSPEFRLECVPTLLELNADGRRLSRDKHFADADSIIKFML